jgi:hypothetical protein
MDSDAVAYAFDAAYVVVPLCLSLIVRRGHRWIALLGIPAIGIEWALAYHDNQVDNGGDWNSGAELVFVTGVLAVLFFLPLWLVGVVIGAGLRRAINRARKRNPQPV